MRYTECIFTAPYRCQCVPRQMRITYLMMVAATCEHIIDACAHVADCGHFCARRQVRMAYLAVVDSHTVNGVAAIHSDIIRNTIFKDFADLWPEKFQNKTNGVTPRRWLAFCNPPLRQLITDTLGTDVWINDLNLLKVCGP